MKRRYKVYNHDHGPYYFDSEAGMKAHVMMQLLSGIEVNVFDRHEEKFVRMTPGTQALRKLVARGPDVH